LLEDKAFKDKATACEDLREASELNYLKAKDTIKKIFNKTGSGN
jgi:hypothetical protein